MTFSNPEAERLVLGGLVDGEHGVIGMDAARLLEASRLEAADFTDPVLRTYFGAVRALAERGRPVDPTAIGATVRGLPGVPANPLGHLLSIATGPALLQPAGRWLTSAEELRRLSKLRVLDAFHRSQLAALEAPRADPAALATATEAFVQGFAGTTAPDETGDADVMELLEDWDAYTQGVRTPFVPTGITTLDGHIGGWVSNLNVVGGLPSVGKSALVAEAVMNQLRAGLRVGVFGLEDATKWIPKRHLSRGLGMRVAAIAATRLHEHQAAQLQEVAGGLHALMRNLLVYRRPGIAPAELLQRCRHWVLNLGVQCIYIDHGGEVRHDSQAARERHDLAVAATYRGLRDLAVTHRVPVVVLCHFNRDADGVGRPRLKSFAETAYIERMARLALGLWERDDDKERLYVEVLKQTEGERDVTLWLPRERQHALVSSLGGGRVDWAAEREEQDRHRKTASSWRAANS